MQITFCKKSLKIPKG